MSTASYEKHKTQMKPHFDKYRQAVPLDTGITSPEGYNVYPDPSPPYILTATQLQPGAAPLYLNPSAALYAQGSENRVLMASSDPQCERGCIPDIHKPDPRVRQVKPLYTPYTFTGKNLPTAYNTVGMY